MKRFTTLSQAASHETEIKKSRFIAYAERVETPEQAMQALERLSDPEATHNCWAYRIGELYRSSDDGEPGGSAGRPILSAIDGQEVDYVLVVVIRWYGGTKLGVGGLIRAYGGCAAECLRLAEKTVVEPMLAVSLHAPFADEATCRHVLDSVHAHIEHIDYHAEGLTMQLQVQADHVERLSAELTEATKGAALLERYD